MMRIGKLIFRLILAGVLILICIPLIWLCLTAFEPEVILFQVNRSDLTHSALTARVDWGGSGGPKVENYYALLILKNPNEIRNWSKLHLNFENDVVPTQSSLFREDINRLCTPIVDFAKSIR